MRCMHMCRQNSIDVLCSLTAADVGLVHDARRLKRGRPLGMVAHVVLVREKDGAHSPHRLDCVCKRGGEARHVDHDVACWAAQQVGRGGEASLGVVAEVEDAGGG